MIYFIKDTSEPSFVKIGFTDRDPEKRLSSLQAGNKNLLEVIREQPCKPKDSEYLIHQRLQDVRVMREWFDLERTSGFIYPGFILTETNPLQRVFVTSLQDAYYLGLNQ